MTALKSFRSLRVRTNPVASARRGAGMLSLITVLSLAGGAMLTGCGGGGGSSSPNNSNPVAGKGAVNTTASNPSGTNANTGAFASSIAAALTSTGAGGFTLFTVTGTSISGINSRTYQIILADNGPIQVGKTYTFSSTGVSGATSLNYTESSAGTASSWIATGGSAIVDSITGKNYKLHLTNVTLATGEDNSSGARGSFTINGTADVTLP